MRLIVFQSIELIEYAEYEFTNDEGWNSSIDGRFSPFICEYGTAAACQLVQYLVSLLG